MLRKPFFTTLKAIVTAMAFLFTQTLLSQTLWAEDTDASTPEPSHKLYFSKENEHGGPLAEAAKQFTCTEKIFSVVELENYPTGKHQLSIVWKDPIDSAREHTKYEFYVQQQHTRLWAWLTLSRATGASMLKWVNPAAGLEEFVGPWQVEVRIDNKKVADGEFEVLC